MQLITEFDQNAAKIVLGDFFYFIKPSITISLMIFFVYNSELRGRFAKLILMGLLFGLFGDVFLMLVNQYPSFFLYGLISFLIGHAFYIAAFYIDYKWKTNIEKKANWLAFIFFSFYAIVFYSYIRPYLGEMKIPVMAYTFVITLMAIMAVNRKGRVSNASFKLVFYGALLFLISDTLLAFKTFVLPFKYSGMLIMFTYMLSQYLIVMGSLIRKKKKHSVIRDTSI